MRILNHLSLALLAVSAILCGVPLASAQTDSGTIAGRVTDASGSVVPNVDVELANLDRGTVSHTTTNTAGIYVVSNVAPGKYNIAVRHAGFRQVDLTNLIVNIQSNIEQNFRLEVGSVSESVTVDGSGVTMNTTDASVSTVIDRKFVANLPLNGRSFQDLIDLTPGVVTHSPQSGGYTGSNGDFSVNGQRTESNNYIVDGVSANTLAGNGGGGTGPGASGSLSASTALGTTQSLISVDALQEFRVQSSTYSAEYGRSPGGQFSFVTRSGTSSLHGSVFDYLRNNFFDANDWFNDHYVISQPALRQNDFGGTVGGPVWIPGHDKGRGKTFFFLSYEGLRLDQPTEASLQYVPSQSLRQSAATAIQPLLNAFSKPTGTEIQIACNNVTFTCPAGLPVGTMVPSGLAPFIQAFSLPSKIDSTSLRLDHTIGARTHVFLRAGYTASSTDSRPYPTTLSSIISNQQNYTGGIDSQISNSLNNELRIGYARSIVKVAENLDDFGGATPINFSQAMGNNSSPSAANSFYMTFPGIGSATLFAQSPANYGRQWNVTDAVTWTLGRHTLKGGIDYRRITSPYAASDPYIEPIYESPNSVLTNSADYAFLERNRSSVPIYNQLAAFGQDEWRVKPTLNLSLGIRWEINPPPHSGNATQPYPLEGNPNDPSTFSLGMPGTSLYGTTWGNFAPRFGAAWQANTTRGAETVLRLGVGLFYDTGSSGTGNALDSIGTSIYTEPAHTALPITPAMLNLSFAVTPPYKTTVWAMAPNLRMPYTLQWSAAVEQAIGEKQNLTISYVAASGKRLIKLNEISGGTLNPDFTTVGLYENGLTSNYQALQLQFQRQVSHGLQALASYTWSHNLDFGSEDGSYGYKRGNADFDLRHNLNAALTWDLPVSRGIAPVRALLNGWGTDARIMLRTGFPVTLTGNTFFDPITGSEQAAGLNIMPGVPFYTYSPLLPGGREVNSMAFRSAPTNTLGDAPRNFIRGFGEEQLNLAIRREFPIHDTFRLQFRAETFNILNHPNFGYVDPTLSDATFGQATSTLAQSLGTVSPQYQQGGARSMQFALKLYF